MTSPIQPNLDPGVPPVASPAGQLKADDEIRQLAAALQPPSTIDMSAQKAVIASVSYGTSTTAPTVTVTLGGVSIPGVAVAANYSPKVGDTVVLIRQLNTYVAAFRIATTGTEATDSTGGWVQLGLASGHSHSTSPILYRLVSDHGAWKMQWQGQFNLGSNDTVNSSALPADLRPSQTRRFAVRRNHDGGSVSIGVDFKTDGNVEIFGDTAAPFSAGSSTSANGGFSGYHNHWYHDAGYTGTNPRLTSTLFDGVGLVEQADHSHSVNSHHHDVTRADWVSFNGVEYFL